MDLEVIMEIEEERDMIGIVREIFRLGCGCKVGYLGLGWWLGGLYGMDWILINEILWFN